MDIHNAFNGINGCDTRSTVLLLGQESPYFLGWGSSWLRWVDGCPFLSLPYIAPLIRDFVPHRTLNPPLTYGDRKSYIQSNQPPLLSPGGLTKSILHRSAPI